jgi:hypothetical protein
MESLPEVITHNYDPRRGPCRNICDLSEVQAERVLDEIRASGLRTIKSDYLKRRRLTEEWLIEESRRLLGPKKLERPVYFFLSWRLFRRQGSVTAKITRYATARVPAGDAHFHLSGQHGKPSDRDP